MVLLSLKIFIKQSNATKTMQFEPSCVVYDACRLIREKTAEAHQGQGSKNCFNVFFQIYSIALGY